MEFQCKGNNKTSCCQSKVRVHGQEHTVSNTWAFVFASALVWFAMLCLSTVSRLLILCSLTLGLQRCQLDLKSPGPGGRKQPCANCSIITKPQLFEKFKDYWDTSSFELSGATSAYSTKKK